MHLPPGSVDKGIMFLDCPFAAFVCLFICYFIPADVLPRYLKNSSNDLNVFLRGILTILY